jgi:DNA-binding LacI/PurR family transcriptional regulator
VCDFVSIKPTIYDVAREAGVSTTTVSKIMNNTGRISAKTRQNVLTIMKELNFQPNVLASAMKGKSTYSIAFLIPDVDNPIYAKYLKHIENYGQKLGYNIVMCSTGNDPNKEVRHITLMRQKRVDGFIIADKFSNLALLKELIAEGFPVTLFAHDRPEFSVDSVSADDYAGGYQAAKHLLSLGHRAIAVIAEESISSRERIHGYRQALLEEGIEWDDSLIVMSDQTMEGAEIQAGKLLDLKVRSTAIFGYNDLTAIGAMMAAKERGLRIPEDLSVIGYDNTSLCNIVDPRLTSINMPVEELGRKVIDLLVGKIEGAEKTKQRIRLLPTLIIRHSTARLKKKELKNIELFLDFN